MQRPFMARSIGGMLPVESNERRPDRGDIWVMAPETRDLIQNPVQITKILNHLVRTGRSPPGLDPTTLD
jgi:hypothetical protein